MGGETTMHEWVQGGHEPVEWSPIKNPAFQDNLRASKTGSEHPQNRLCILASTNDF